MPSPAILTWPRVNIAHCWDEEHSPIPLMSVPILILFFFGLFYSFLISKFSFFPSTSKAFHFIIHLTLQSQQNRNTLNRTPHSLWHLGIFRCILLHFSEMIPHFSADFSHLIWSVLTPCPYYCTLPITLLFPDVHSAGLRTCLFLVTSII